VCLSSLSHLTAVSGSNCAVLVALTMLLGGVLGVPRVLRVVAASAVLLAFLVLVTPDASIVRATVMALIVLGHLAGSRPVSGLPVVAVAVTGMLLADPWISRSLGFALSVLATAGLVVLSAPLARLLSRVMPEPLALLLAVPIAAQLACGPVLLLLDPGLPLHGVAANVLAEPAAPVATVLGLVVCVLAAWAPGPAALVAQVAWAPASWVAAVARSVATWPAARVEWGQGVVAVGLLTVLTALVVVLVLAGRGGTARRAAATGLVVVVVISGGAVLGMAVGTRSSVPADWTVAQCDVGQGDAVLVRSADRVALIDAGDDEEALARCLGLFGVDRLDLLVLTHFDADHVGAVDVVADRADVALVGPVGRTADQQVVESLTAAGAQVVDARAGTHGVLGDLSWEVLWPPITGSSPAPGNEASLVTRFRPGAGCRAGCLDLVALGDLGESEQRRLAATGTFEGEGVVDVVKVAHHGSADQDADLYRSLGAPIALIGVGADNTYGHPTDPLLDVLAESSAAVARSDVDGSTAVVVDDGGLRLWRERASSSEASSTLVAASVPHPVAGGGPWPRERVPSRRRRPVSPSTRSGGTESGPPP
jgi:competence protein ComEC